MPARHDQPGMGVIYVARDHPQIPPISKGERALVVLWDFSPENLIQIHERASKAEAPSWAANLAELGGYSVQAAAVELRSAVNLHGRPSWLFLGP